MTYNYIDDRPANGFYSEFDKTTIILICAIGIFLCLAVCAPLFFVEWSRLGCAIDYLYIVTKNKICPRPALSEYVINTDASIDIGANTAHGLAVTLENSLSNHPESTDALEQSALGVCSAQSLNYQSIISESKKNPIEVLKY